MIMIILIVIMITIMVIIPPPGPRGVLAELGLGGRASPPRGRGADPGALNSCMRAFPEAAVAFTMV